MKVIFMGTPEFAVPTLKSIVNSKEHQVTAAFTSRPKAKGRGLVETPSPVHQICLQHNIPVFTPVSLKKEETKELIDSLEADIIVVVAYGFIIPKNILESKKYGCLNIHPSMLPKYRGAAPLQRTIINGEKETSVCVIQMDEGLDTGDIILEEKFDLHSRITLKELHDKCSIIGANLLIQTINQIDYLPKIKQKEDGALYAHKLTKEEGIINWLDDAYKIDCMVRGMNPWPGVYFNYKDKVIKILEAEYTEKPHQLVPGTVMNESLEVACGNGSLIIKKLQQQGKNPLEAAEFMRGVDIPVGTFLN